MFDFKIESVAETLLKQVELFNCSIKSAWNNYIHSLIKEKFSLEEVLEYIENNKE